MGVDFSHLKKLNVSGDTTARFILHDIDTGDSPAIVLIVAPATEANSAYFNGLLKRSKRTAEMAKRVRRGKINASMLADNRNEDRGLYPETIVRGWENVVDAKGKPVAFSKQNAEGFLQALPDWIFDDLRAFCGDPTNFSSTGEEVEDTAKN